MFYWPGLQSRPCDAVDGSWQQVWKKSLELFSDGLPKNVSNIVSPLLLSVVSLPVGVEMRSNCESFMSLQCQCQGQCQCQCQCQEWGLLSPGNVDPPPRGPAVGHIIRGVADWNCHSCNSTFHTKEPLHFSSLSSGRGRAAQQQGTWHDFREATVIRD